MNRSLKHIMNSLGKSLTVWTDGGATNNGKRNCKAAWAVFFKDDDSRNESGEIFSQPSNQKAELYAINIAVKKILQETSSKLGHYDKVTIVTDSQYSIDCFTKWLKSWEKNNWKTYKKEPVKHSELIKDTNELIKKVEMTLNTPSIEWKHINSHKIPPKDESSEEYRLWYGNHIADSMAGKVLRKDIPILSNADGVGVLLDWNTNEVSVDTEQSGNSKGSSGAKINKKRKTSTKANTSEERGIEVTW